MGLSPYKEINRLINEGKLEKARLMLSEFLEKYPHDEGLWILALSGRLEIQDPDHPLNRVIEQCVSMLKTKYPTPKIIASTDRVKKQSDEEAVYAAIIREIFTLDKLSGPHPIVISDRTAANKSTQVEYYLDPMLDLGTPYKLLSEVEWEEIEQYGSWWMFRRLYPNKPGILSLSAVEFSAQRDQAFVETGHTFDILMGMGMRWRLSKHEDGLFSRQPGGWKVENKQGTWIS